MANNKKQTIDSKLNAKQEMFIQLVAQGCSQREAYKKAYKVDYDDRAIDNNASKLFNKDYVQHRYNELMTMAERSAIMSIQERMEWLSNVVKGEQKETRTIFSNGEPIDLVREADVSTKIKAMDTLNKMDNVYQQNVNVNGTINNPYANLTEEELRKLAK